MRIPKAIADNYGKSPTKPLRIAQALNMLPASSHFRMLTGSAAAYGLTDGGYNLEAIGITALGRRVVAPSVEGDERAAMREAILRPRVIREFLTKYNGSRFPQPQIAKNVLEEMGVPVERAQTTFELIEEGARLVGFIHEVKGQPYVDLESTPITGGAPGAADKERELPLVTEPAVGSATPRSEQGEEAATPLSPVATIANNRVFITHGKNKEIAGQLKELLTFGSFQPIVSVEQETVSKPVPDKVMDDMRSCAAAIIHVGTEKKFLDEAGNEQRVLNPNVLIEIGAAMALYRRQFILLVENGVTLPSNLQGLYEVRYEGGPA
ncbi:MAG: TIR domain-containing protein [Gemmatimonadaceae bacterium]